MRMTQVLLAAWFCRTSLGFVSYGCRQSAVVPRTAAVPTTATKASWSIRLFSVSNGIEADVKLGVSRVETLQKLLACHGAPGSLGCSQPRDLEPVFVSAESEQPPEDTPELISTIVGMSMNDYVNLHPHLYPLAKSKSTGNLVCALRRAFAEGEWYETSTNAPWPIVEARLGGPGMRLLALSSEHLMRRIACEADFEGERAELVELYNKDLGKNMIKDKGLDQPYERGSVEKLG
mmetsp:Transcript_17079/g.27722  ORF Transcript_17079/g.27722 Transcript_17079/m.27722 type:complete len:234 (+) Transcript_17079:1130-1831(+)